MKLIADEQILFESPDPATVFCYTPALCRGFDDRIIASFDLGGPGVAQLDGPKSDHGDFGLGNQARIMVSDDGGRHFRPTGTLPLLHGRVFRAGGRLYFIGHSGRLAISGSDDNGESWSAPAVLDPAANFHQSACGVDYRHGKIYLTMEHQKPGSRWPGVSIILMAADETADLRRPDRWTRSEPFVFERLSAVPNPLGVPFYPTGFTCPDHPAMKRFCGDPGFLESNVLRIYDPDHQFFDPADRSVTILMRAHTGLANLGAIARGVESPDGNLRIEPFVSPAGTPLVYVPLPGGQMKFQVLYDEPSRRYWLVSSQTTDSMTRPERLPEERYGLPDNERHRLALYFSKNLFDWVFAGMVAVGESPKCSRHYAGMTATGDDLLILSRSGDRRAKNAHNGNLLTLHRVRDFRALVY